MKIQLSHPYRWLQAGEVVDLPEPEARKLVRAGHARHLDVVLEKLGGSWYRVPARRGKARKVQGRARAVAVLEELWRL